MIAAAAMAAQSDSDGSYDFASRWSGPPDDRSSGRVVGTTRNADPKDNTTTETNTASAPRGPWVSLPERGEMAHFQYEDFSPDVAALARQAADNIRGWQKKSIVDIGNALLQVKTALDHGAFGRWLAAEFAMTTRTAENYMAAATFLDGKSEMVSFLPPTAIYALASPSADPIVVEAVLSEVEAGIVIPATAVRDRLKEATKARRDAEAAAKKTPEEIKKAKEAEKRRRTVKEKREEKWRREVSARKQQEAAASRAAANLLFENLSPEEIVVLLRLTEDVSWHKVADMFLPERHFGDRVGAATAASVVANFTAKTGVQG